MTWGIWIALYLFLAGVGAGTFITAAAAEALRRPESRPLVRGGLLISGPLVALGIPCLLLDLGAGKTNPWRLIWLYLGNVQSPMLWGTWLLTLFIPVALLLGWLEVDFLTPPWRGVTALRGMVRRHRTLLLQVGTLLALGVAIYTGLLLGVVHGFPLWNTSILPMLFFVSALSTGLAAVVVFSEIAAMTAERDGVALARQYFYVNQVHSAMIITETIFIFCWLFIVANGSVTAAQSVAMLISGRYSVLFWIGIVFFGIVDPMLIYIYEVVMGKPLMPYAVLVSDGSVLLGGVILRYLAIAAALPVVLT